MLSRRLRVMAEVRALAYEANELRDYDAHALGMIAIASSLSEQCRSEKVPTDLMLGSLSVLRGYVLGNEPLRKRLAIEQGERTRPYSLHPYEELARFADSAAASAYLIYARATGVSQDNIRQCPGCCSPVSLIMQRELRKQGVEAQRMRWYEGGNNHFFLQTDAPNGDKIFMDPTWQQFLPPATDYSQHPHVLLGPTDQMVTLLELHGVPELSHPSWLDAKAQSETSAPGMESRIKEVFYDDPWIPPLEEG